MQRRLFTRMGVQHSVEALFKAVEQQGLKLDVQRYLVEMIVRLIRMMSKAVTFSFQLPVLATLEK